MQTWWVMDRDVSAAGYRQTDWGEMAVWNAQAPPKSNSLKLHFSVILTFIQYEKILQRLLFGTVSHGVEQEGTGDCDRYPPWNYAPVQQRLDFDVLQSGTGSLGLYLRLIRDLETEGDGENIGRSKCDVFRGQIPKTQDPTNSSVDVSSHSHSHLHTHSQL